MEEENKCLQAALKYRAMGLSIIPCKLWFEGEQEYKAHKKPLVGWTEFRQRIATEEEIRGWWQRWPDAQVGIVTGKVSQNLVVVDIDDGAETEKIAQLCVPPSIMARSPRGTGHHIYLRGREGEYIKSSADVLGGGSKIDIRGEGGFVVAPPSTYPNGKAYEWMEEFDWENVAQVSDTLSKVMCDTARKVTSSNNFGTGVGEGSRNTSAASYMGKVLGTLPLAQWETVGWDALVGWNTKNTPPLSIQELKSVFESIKGREAVNRVGETIAVANIEAISWKEFKIKEFNTARWRIKDLVALQGITIIAAPSGEKKTWIALEMAKCIANGEQFLGRHKSEKGNVLYLDAEMAQSELQRRGKLLDLPDNILISSVDQLNLNSNEGVNVLLDFLRNNSISVVIVDTLRAVAGGLHEDKAEEVRKFFSRFKSLKDGGYTIIFLDHCRKPIHFEGRVPKKEQLLGSQDKTGNAEILLMVKSEEGSDEIACHVVKNRISKGIVPFKIKIQEELGIDENPSRTDLIYAGELDVVRETKKEMAKEFILKVLGEQGEKTTPELKELASTVGIGEKNVSAALHELYDDKEVAKRKDGQANSYSLPGINMDIFGEEY